MRVWPRPLVRGTTRPDRYLLVQSLKAAGAAAGAWALTGWWLQAPMALMAPWTAVALVQGTVYRSVRTAAELLLMITSGTLLAAGAAALTSDTMTAMIVVLPLAVLIGNCAPVGGQGLYAPTTALFVLAYGSYSPYAVGHRLLETAVGAAVGIAVNALVLPPVHSLQVSRLACALPMTCADLLRDIAGGAGDYDEARATGWYEGAQALYRDLADLRDARGWAYESVRLNPAQRLRRNVRAAPPEAWDSVWTRVSDRLLTLTLTLLETASDRRRLPRPPAATLTELSALLTAAAEVCRVDRAVMEDGPGTESRRLRREHLARAHEAHTAMHGTLSGAESGVTASIGSLLADTQALLDDLTPAGEPEGTQQAERDPAPDPRSVSR
ncbi:FUSC family protein [Streptomyces sp. NPDC005899]|uniref:FUSC family protein n=1 Tax=Streptomyces sp. NPDC005899 TaxID=3155716 RepID=UPI0033E08253